MPFIAKATYRKETRKFTFYDGHFPTYDELYQQIYRVFSIDQSQAIYLQKLIFSPVNSTGAIMIATEARSVEQYNVHCVTYRDRIYHNGRLSFTIVHDTTGNSQPVESNPSQLSSQGPSTMGFPLGFVPNFNQAAGNASIYSTLPLPPPPPPPLPPPAIRHPLPQRISEYRSSVSMDVDTEEPTATASSKDTQTKKEMQDMMDEFLRNFRRVMSSSGFAAGQSFFDPLDTPTRAPSPLPPLSLDTSLHIPGSFLHRRPVTPTRDKVDEEKSQAPHQLEPSQTLHPGIWCDFCGKAIRGLRFNCQECPEYDLCANCIVVNQALEKHNEDKHTIHKFNTISPPSQSSNTNKPISVATIINPVMPLLSVLTTKSMERLHPHIVCDGCRKPVAGNRFKCLNCPDFDLCDNCIGSASTGHSANHHFLKLETPSKIRFHTTHVPTQDANPNIVSFHNARCNLCDSRIAGARYKCTDCPDFDTCEQCFAIVPEQHPLHTFVKVTDPKDFMLRRSTPVRHFATCDGCTKTIVGIRYKCMHPDCPDFDLCADCEALPIPVHPMTHAFLKLRHGNTFIPTVQRNASQPQQTQLQARVDVIVQTPSTPPPKEPEAVPTSLANSIYETPGSSPVPVAVAFEEQSQPIQSTVPVASPPQGILNAAGPSAAEIQKTVDEQLVALAEARRQRHEEVKRIIGQRMQHYAEQQEPAPAPTVPVPEVPTPAPAPSAPEMTQASLNFLTPSFMNQTSSPLIAVFLSDNNIPDGHVFPPGAEFVKSWRVKNTGPEAWEGVHLSFVGGDRLSGTAGPTVAYYVSRVAAGEEVDVAAGEMRAPESPGRYMSFWRLHDAQGRPFGPKMWCDIEVVEVESDHSSLASSAVIMPQNHASQTLNAHLMSPTTARSSTSVATLSDAASSDGSASVLEAADSDWDDIPDVPVNRPTSSTIQDEYHVVYDSGSETGRI
ncbi:hypothetical protein M422DRAFT_25208 [Sphaerobolus stellatus SS14]|nr:hypothetical protein M422DRAFT_25208 [Sphaerobolus stellatus SS14]